MITCYRFGAGGASLGEQFSETIGAIGLVVARRESLASQGIVTVATGEAVSVPRLVLVRYPTAGDDLKTIKKSLFTFSSTSFPSRRKLSSSIIGLKGHFAFFEKGKDWISFITLLHLTHRVANLSS